MNKLLKEYQEVLNEIYAKCQYHHDKYLDYLSEAEKIEDEIDKLLKGEDK